MTVPFRIVDHSTTMTDDNYVRSLLCTENPADISAGDPA